MRNKERNERVKMYKRGKKEEDSAFGTAGRASEDGEPSRTDRAKAQQRQINTHVAVVKL